MSEFFITHQEAEQARLDALDRPATRPAPNRDTPWNEALWRGVQAGAADLGSVVARGGELFANLPNTALETPAYLLPVDPTRQQALRRVTDPDYGEVTDVAAAIRRSRESLDEYRLQRGRNSEAYSDASRMMFEVSRALTPALVALPVGGGGSVAALTATGGQNTFQGLTTTGVPEEVAANAAAMDMAWIAGTSFLPISLPGRLVRRALTGGAIGAVAGVGQRASVSDYLEGEGESEAAELYRWDNPQAIGVDVGLNAALAALLGPRSISAGLRAQNQSDLAERYGWVDRQTAAIEQVMGAVIC